MLIGQANSLSSKGRNSGKLGPHNASQEQKVLLIAVLCLQLFNIFICRDNLEIRKGSKCFKITVSHLPFDTAILSLTVSFIPLAH